MGSACGISAPMTTALPISIRAWRIISFQSAGMLGFGCSPCRTSPVIAQMLLIETECLLAVSAVIQINIEFHGVNSGVQFKWSLTSTSASTRQPHCEAEDLTDTS